MKVSDFKNKYKGEIAFLLGGGPSLHDVDIDLITDHVCIAVNSGIQKYPFCKYFISDDEDIKNWSYYNDFIKTSSCVKFLYDKKFKNICRDLENVVLFKHKSFFSPENNVYNLDGLKLTKEEPIIGSRTSMGSAAHLSFLMGCDPIVLLGNDCRLSKNGKRYYWQFPGEEKQYRTDKRDFNKTQNRGFDRKAFIEYWECFAEVNKDSDVTIIDASDSSLNCFPKMSIKEVLNKYGRK